MNPKISRPAHAEVLGAEDPSETHLSETHLSETHLLTLGAALREQLTDFVLRPDVAGPELRAAWSALSMTLPGPHETWEVTGSWSAGAVMAQLGPYDRPQLTLTCGERQIKLYGRSKNELMLRASNEVELTPSSQRRLERVAGTAHNLILAHWWSRCWADRYWPVRGGIDLGQGRRGWWHAGHLLLSDRSAFVLDPGLEWRWIKEPAEARGATALPGEPALEAQIRAHWRALAIAGSGAVLAR